MSGKPIGNLGIIDTITVGERQLAKFSVPNDASLIQITGYVNSSGGAAFSSPRLANGTTGYQVTSGKSMIVVAYKMYNSAPGAGGVFFGYNDTDQGMYAGGSPSNPIWFAGQNAATARGFLYTEKADYISEGQIPGFIVPSGKYLFMQNVVSGAVIFVTFFGYEYTP